MKLQRKKKTINKPIKSINNLVMPRCQKKEQHVQRYTTNQFSESEQSKSKMNFTKPAKLFLVKPLIEKSNLLMLLRFCLNDYDLNL